MDRSARYGWRPTVTSMGSDGKANDGTRSQAAHDCAEKVVASREFHLTALRFERGVMRGHVDTAIRKGRGWTGPPISELLESHDKLTSAIHAAESGTKWLRLWSAIKGLFE